jgi:uncharacterized protein (TIGR02145 family)
MGQAEQQSLPGVEEMRRKKTDFNLEEIKVRWKKAALENCTGAPCVTTPPVPPFVCGTSTIADFDGNTYNTVLIGTQCWTKENLRVTKYNDGTAIPLDATQTSPTDGTSLTWQNRLAAAYTIYDNESSTGANATNYGFLYNWYAAKGIATALSTTYKNICPTGWHVPTDSDWNKLVISIDSGADTTATTNQSSIAGGRMKSTGTTLWNSPNTDADNTSGFTALPGARRDISGAFPNILRLAWFWSATENGISNAWPRNVSFNSSGAFRNSRNKSEGASVRCLKD